MATISELIESKQNEGFLPIRTADVGGFRSDQVIYRMLRVDEDSPNDSKYYQIFVPKRHRGPGWLQSLLYEIASKGYSSKNTDEEENRPLDIPVYQDTVIIVQLPQDGRYVFKEPGIMLKETREGEYPSGYGQLRYIDNSGRMSSTYVPDCKMICFWAKARLGSKSKPYRQEFSYIIDGPRAFYIEIDPDIRHPGNGSSGPED